MSILVTGAAGFIGYHAAQRLLGQGRRVTGVDNLNAYYDPALKRARLARLTAHPRFQFIEADLAHRSSAEHIFSAASPARDSYDAVLHLAAQAGVRYSLENPHAYTEANITGFLNVLEGCRRLRIPRLIYASSSSVYGGNTKTPFAVGDPVETPVSLYAATKRANELMAHCYTHLYGFAATGLRFFTVYGPWGRPDMAPFRFAEAIERGARIDIYNYGRMFRDFTYIDDIVEGLVRVIDRPEEGHKIYNIGNAKPVALMGFVHALERALGKRARRRFMPLQAGDVVATHADGEDFCDYTGFRPVVPVEEGVARFADWYRGYYSRAARARVA
ncbi:MAG: SDR family NAD(P)-dependent oxidoreductase [Acidobacteriota bacterium]